MKKTWMVESASLLKDGFKTKAEAVEYARKQVELSDPEEREDWARVYELVGEFTTASVYETAR